jgi:predicted RNA-binding protein with RPS1 domain
MKVLIRNKRPENKSDRHGYKIDFFLPDENLPKHLVIYQNIKVKIVTIDDKGDKDKIKYKFTEAWKYSKNKKITDSFLVPIDWRVNQKGFMKVTSKIWVEEGKINPSLKKGTSRDYWGNLHGSFDLLEPKGEITYRNEKISWDNLGKTKKSTFTKGQDLQYKI